MITSTYAKNLDNLIEIAKIEASRNPTVDQIKAFDWLQESTGKERQEQFAALWRGGVVTIPPQPPIKFSDVFRYYSGLEHQNAAIGWLQRTTQPKTITEFLRLWNKANEQIVNASYYVKLNVKYYNQVDNLYEPTRTCNTSSCAMVASYLGAKISGDDEYYQIVRKYGDTTDHAAQTKALKEIGISSEFHYNLDFNDIDCSLEEELPVVIGILHHGSLRNPSGGHMIVVIGKTAKRDYIVHDPYGSLLDKGGAYTGAVENGKGVVYPRYVLNARWLADGAKSGWGRLFKKGANK